MNRIFFLFFVLGPLVIPFTGCVSQTQMNMQRALFAQEYRQLEDELFLAYQNMDRLAKSNANFRAQLGQEFQDENELPIRSNQRRTNPVTPNLNPISTEGTSPSENIPDILQNPQSRSLVKPLPQSVEQTQFIEPEFATRPRQPTGHTTVELPLWRPNR